MPLLMQNSQPSATYLRFGIWQITEPESFFTDAMHWPDEVWAEISAANDARRLESMAARYLLHLLTEAEHQPWLLLKDHHHKPAFPQHEEWHCSLSHSHGVVAAVLSKRPCGIDLQRFTPKMDILAPKFVNEAELDLLATQPATNHLDALHCIWTAKEAMYKVYGRRELDFKRHMHIADLGFEQTDTRNGLGRVEKNEILQHCTLRWEAHVVHEQRYWVCVAEEKS